MTFTATGNEFINNIQGLQANGQIAAINEQATLVQLTNFEGSMYQATAQSATSNTTLAPITFTSPVTGASSFAVVAGGVYIMDIYVSVTNGASGGLKLAFGGTATATLLSTDIWAYNGTTLAAQGVINSLASTLVAYTGSVTTVNVTGTFVAATSGTLLLQFAQNASNATATTINAGSNFWIDRIG